VVKAEREGDFFAYAGAQDKKSRKKGM